MTVHRRHVNTARHVCWLLERGAQWGTTVVVQAVLLAFTVKLVTKKH